MTAYRPEREPHRQDDRPDDDYLPDWAGVPPSSKVPPFVRYRRRSPKRQGETLLKLVGGLLIVIALIGGVLLSEFDRGGSNTPTPTANPALVIAANTQIDEVTPAPSLPAAGTVVAAPDPRYQNFTICLDPGHGGSDRGFQRKATAVAPAMDESYFSLAIAKALRERLEARGFKVVMTRTEDRTVNSDRSDTNRDGKTGASGENPAEARTLDALDETQARIDRCNDTRSDLLISIHLNGSDNTVNNGSATYFDATRSNGPLNQLLATMIDEELGIQLPAAGYHGANHAVFDLRNAGATDHAGAQTDRLLLEEAPDSLKEPSAMPGVIVELLMISNDDDALFLSNDRGLNALASALEQAVVRYVDLTIPR